jgi:UDP-glucose 4-epimerase
MKIAITGGSGRIGRAVTEAALAAGHGVVSLDRVAHPGGPLPARLSLVTADVADYDALARAFAGCDALIHLAAIPSPFRDPDHLVHNNNVVGSYNAMRAAVENGIMRICQASSVNAIGLSYSRAPRFDYFPIDERHPNYTEEPYGLSKWICEQQADSFARRHADLRIASLRFHWVVPDRATAFAKVNGSDPQVVRELWAYTTFDAAARAALLSLEADYRGHEALYIAAPDTANERPSLDLAREHYPDVPLRGDLGGHRSFFDSSKAERLLGWRHDARAAGRGR